MAFVQHGILGHFAQTSWCVTSCVWVQKYTVLSACRLMFSEENPKWNMRQIILENSLKLQQLHLMHLQDPKTGSSVYKMCEIECFPLHIWNIFKCMRWVDDRAKLEQEQPAYERSATLWHPPWETSQSERSCSHWAKFETVCPRFQLPVIIFSYRTCPPGQHLTLQCMFWDFIYGLDFMGSLRCKNTWPKSASSGHVYLNLSPRNFFPLTL